MLLGSRLEVKQANWEHCELAGSRCRPEHKFVIICGVALQLAFGRPIIGLSGTGAPSSRILHTLELWTLFLNGRT